MPLFGRRSKEAQREAHRPSPEQPPNDPDGMREATNALSALYEAKVHDAEGRIRVEDLLSAAAAACGEACIAAASDFDLEHHTFAPGAAVLSDRVNAILVADAPDWSAAATSVFGIIRGGALAQGYAADGLPVARRADPAVRGRRRRRRDGSGPVGVRAAERAGGASPVRPAPAPGVRAAGRRARRSSPSTRFPPTSGRPPAPSRWSWSSRASARPSTRGSPCRLVLETVNGMAKTAPMTDRHMREVRRHRVSGRLR